MEQERRAMRIGLILISFAVIWKLIGGGVLSPVMAFFQDPEVASFLIYLETGRVARLSAQAETESATTTVPAESTSAEPTPAETAATAPQETVEESPAVCFSEADSALVTLYDMCGYTVSAQELLLQPLEWELTGAEPTVLILHTHATESYTKTEDSYVETAAFRTLNEGYNMVQVGERLTQQLESLGIGVLHDRTLHDYPSYTGSYNNSRQTAQKYLQQYPSIRIVLDIHRDAAEYSDGSQMATSATVDGKASAQLMIVVGTDAGGLSHPQWQQNMALASKLHVTLEKRWPGITRPICFRSERFNQDLLPGALLVEVGAAGNTLEEALVAADALAQAIAALSHGANAG